MKSIALCSVVYNEIERIPKLVKHAREIGLDEICIVDQTSTDGTWEWLNDHREEFGLKLKQDRHWGYCEPSRHWAHKLTETEWILVLDADEQISDEFREVMREVNEHGWWGVRLKRAFYLAGEHRFTGDYQYRFFHKGAVFYLTELHTEPQPNVSEDKIWSPEFVGIEHNKSWVEQIRDEMAYEKLVGTPKDDQDKAKLELNVHLKLLREKGITAEEADHMSLEDRELYGLTAQN